MSKNNYNTFKHSYLKEPARMKKTYSNLDGYAPKKPSANLNKNNSSKIFIKVVGELKRGFVNNRVIIEYHVSGLIITGSQSRTIKLGSDVYVVSPEYAKLSSADLDVKLQEFRKLSAEKFEAYIILKSKAAQVTEDTVTKLSETHPDFQTVHDYISANL